MTKPSTPKVSEELSEFFNEKLDEICDRIEDVENSNNIVIELNVSFSGVEKEKYSWKRKHATRSIFNRRK